MCRHLGYVGPSVAVGEIVTRGPHSLRLQAWAPRDMRSGGTINADGFGVAWWIPAAQVRVVPPADVRSRESSAVSGTGDGRTSEPEPEGVSAASPGDLAGADRSVTDFSGERSAAGSTALDAEQSRPASDEAAAPAIGPVVRQGDSARSTGGSSSDAQPEFARGGADTPTSADAGQPRQVGEATAAAAVEVRRLGSSGATEGGDSAGEGRTPRGAGDPAEANVGVRGAVDRLVASRYRNAAPIWTDPAVDEVLPQLNSVAVLAAVRSATVGMPVERAACAPFVAGRWAFSHNGAIPRWRRVLTAVSSDLDGIAMQAGLARLFETQRLLEAESSTDAATAWVLLDRLLDAVDPDGFVGSPSTALRLLTRSILAHEPAARLNFLLGDGETLWATTVHHSLSALVTAEFAVLSSEPYDDDPGWRSIPDRCLVTARPGHLSIEPLTPPLDTTSSRDTETPKGRPL